jgi:glycosyltransferase involved in cell wall biosynthesis
MTEPREIEVLLATYNGAKYIREFLESLLRQEGVKIHLRISDDGSTDDTIKICHEYSEKFNRITFQTGPKAGPAANFYSLLRSSSGEMIALADQDDLWQPNHLIDSIARVELTPERPTLTYAKVREFNSESGLDQAKLWPRQVPKGDIREVLTWNPARGCTIVLNRKAVEIINSHPPQKAIMHDWWALLCIFAVGKVSCSTEAEIYYRLHETNTIGVPRSRSARIRNWFLNLKSSGWPILEQARELLEIHGSKMDLETIANLSIWCDRLASRRWRDKLMAALFLGRYRADLIDEAIVRLTFLLLPMSRRFSR